MKTFIKSNIKFVAFIVVSILILLLMLRLTDELLVRAPAQQYNDYNIQQVEHIVVQMDALQADIEGALFSNIIYSQMLIYENIGAQHTLEANIRGLGAMLRTVKDSNPHIVDVFMFSIDNDQLLTSTDVYTKGLFFKNVYGYDMDKVYRMMSMDGAASARSPLTVSNFIYKVPGGNMIHDTIAYVYTPLAVAGKAKVAILLTVEKSIVLGCAEKINLMDAAGTVLISDRGEVLGRNDYKLLDTSYSVADLRTMALKQNEKNGVSSQTKGNTYKGMWLYCTGTTSGKLNVIKITRPTLLIRDMENAKVVKQMTLLVSAAMALVVCSGGLILFRYIKTKNSFASTAAAFCTWVKEYGCETLREWIFNPGDMCTKTDRSAELAKLDWDAEGRECVICLLHIQEKKESPERELQRALTLCQELIKAAVKLLQTEYMVKFFVQNDSMVVAFLQKKEPRSLDLTELLVKLDKLHNIFAGKRDCALEICIGSLCKDVTAIRQSYMDAKKCRRAMALPWHTGVGYSQQEAFISGNRLSKSEIQVIRKVIIEGEKNGVDEILAIVRQHMLEGLGYESFLQLLYEVLIQTEKCAKLFERLAEEKCINYGKMVSDMSVCETKEDFMCLLTRWVGQAQSEILAFKAQNVKDSGLKKRIMAYMEDNFDRDFSLVDMAESFGFSSSYFSRTFKVLIGENMGDYLHALRMRKFEEYMNANNAYSMKEAAKMVGYNSYKTFSRQYKKIFGIAPSTKKR